MTTAPASAVNAFRRDTRGSILPTFAVMFMGVTLSAGVALDYGRIHHANTRMTAAADAAAIAAGKALLDGRNSDSDIQEIARKFFEQNLNGTPGFAHVNSFSADIDRTTNTVTIRLESAVPTTVMKLARVDEVSLPVTSVATFEQKDIELALALDVTGSMCSGARAPCLHGTKIDGLKDATVDLLDIMLPDSGTPNKVRVGFVPYANGVNAGTYAAAATNNRSPNGCTFERQGAVPEGDQAPGPGSFLYTSADTSANCPANAKVIAMTADKSLLKSTVLAYQADGSTAGHLGAQWASYLVSPNWGGVVGSESAAVPYDDGKTVKAVVLMTDGDNNTFGGRGAPRWRSDDREREICTAMRAKGVMVFAIGFGGALNAVSERVLKDCAGDNSRFFLAADGDQLRQAFAAIGQQLNNLRISK